MEPEGEKSHDTGLVFGGGVGGEYWWEERILSAMWCGRNVL